MPELTNRHRHGRPGERDHGHYHGHSAPGATAPDPGSSGMSAHRRARFPDRYRQDHLPLRMGSQIRRQCASRVGLRSAPPPA
jgi:hypothetical protein